MRILALLVVLYASTAQAQSYIQHGFGLSTKITVDHSQVTVKYVRVQSIQCGSPAYHAGIHAGDRILAINGITISGMLLGDYLPLARSINMMAKVVSLKMERGTNPHETYHAKLVDGPNVDDETCRQMVRV